MNRHHDRNGRARVARQALATVAAAAMQAAFAAPVPLNDLGPPEPAFDYSGNIVAVRQSGVGNAASLDRPATTVR